LFVIFALLPLPILVFTLFPFAVVGYLLRFLRCL
jgi:hypothetical protein